MKYPKGTRVRLMALPELDIPEQVGTVLDCGADGETWIFVEIDREHWLPGSHDGLMELPIDQVIEVLSPLGNN